MRSGTSHGAIPGSADADTTFQESLPLTNFSRCGQRSRWSDCAPVLTSNRGQWRKGSSGQSLRHGTNCAHRGAFRALGGSAEIRAGARKIDGYFGNSPNFSRRCCPPRRSSPLPRRPNRNVPRQLRPAFARPPSTLRPARLQLCPAPFANGSWWRWWAPVGNAALSTGRACEHQAAMRRASFWCSRRSVHVQVVPEHPAADGRRRLDREAARAPVVTHQLSATIRCSVAPDRLGSRESMLPFLGFVPTSGVEGSPIGSKTCDTLSAIRPETT